MTSLLPIALLGLFLGMRHATDPDHVIAVTTIVSREKSPGRAAWLGVLWGVGHTATILVVGSAIVLFGLTIPARIGLLMELGVAVMLILLGIRNLTGLSPWTLGAFVPAFIPVTVPFGRSGSPARVHSHAHRHGDYVHTHPHPHESEPAHRASAHAHGSPRHGHAEDATPTAWLDRRLGRIGPYLILRPIIVGLVHGLAGSAAIALLVLTMIREPLGAIVYLFVFGLGTIAGMTLVTAAISVPFVFTAGRWTRLNGWLGFASGVVSLAFGLFLVYRVGFVDGLFLPIAHGSPR